MGGSRADGDLEPANKSFDQCVVPLIDKQQHPKRLIDAKSRIYVEFSDLCYTVPCRKGKDKKILQDVSGHFRPGKLMGIVGPSGAGKTSLLSIITGLKASNIKGSITVNGKPRNTDKFRRSACYIPQEFALLPCLTTRETLYIAARLKLGKPHSRESRQLVVEDVANNLGLLNCMDTMTDQLSGGEKKRLSLGVEFITRPTVMLLDEPTSGLDSVASNQVVLLLKDIAKMGCTVVCAIHQPNSQMLSQFDDIFVLAKGRNFYCGPREEILETFRQAGYNCPPFYNIAEFVIEVVTGERDGDLDLLCKVGNAKYNDTKLRYEVTRRTIESSDEADASNSDSSAPSYSKDDLESKKESNETTRVSTWDQQIVLLHRAIICIQRDNTMTKLRLAVHVIVALLLGLVFYRFGDDSDKVLSNVACIFFFLLFLFFANAMPAVQTYPVEATVFLREHLNNWYCLRTYYIAKVLTDIPLQILCPSSFLFIAYYMTGQPLEFDRFFCVWIVCILISVLAQLLGVVTGAAFDTHLGCFLVPALNIPMFLFAGFFLKLKEIPSYLQPFSAISYFRYGFEGILQAIYGSNREIRTCVNADCPMMPGRNVLTKLNMPSMSFTAIIVSLIAWILCLHLTIYLVLRWKLYRATK